MDINKIAEKRIFITPRMECLSKTFDMKSKVFIHTVIHSHPSVAVIVRNEVGEIAIIKQFRTTTEQWYWELLAGIIEDKESQIQAAIRESLEETGIVVKDVEVLIKGPSILDPSKSDEDFGVATAVVESQENCNLDENEIIESNVVWMNEGELYERLRHQMLNNGHFYEGLYMSGHSAYALLSAYFLK